MSFTANSPRLTLTNLNNAMKTILLIAGLAIITVMVGYLISLLIRLQKQKTQFQQARLARFERIQDSLLTIAKAMQQGECNHSEGVIRLTMLLKPLGQDLRPYPNMAALYDVVMDMPTHDARQALEKAERRKLDHIREEAEQNKHSGIQAELPRFIQQISALRCPKF